MRDNERLMKISEIADAAGVSKQTVHFYLREGLLSPPVQKSRNMAYYDHRHIEEIRLIKELQEKRYLPLSVIKMVLESWRMGIDMDSPDHLDILEKLFIETRDEVGEDHRTLEMLIEETGLSEEQIEKMESAGLLCPSYDTGGKRYDGFDAALARAMGRLLDLGMEVQDLSLYSRFLDLFRVEIDLVLGRIIHRRDGGHDHPPLRDIHKALSYARSLLEAKATREAMVRHLHSGSEEERGDGSD